MSCTETGKLAGKKTSTVDIYRKYENIDKNPDKYKEWKDIELEIVIKNKTDNFIYVTKNCFPYDFSEKSEGYYIRSRCHIGYILNGMYSSNVTVLKSHSDFKNNKSNIIFAYPSVNAIKLSHFVWRMEAMNSHTDDPFFNAIRLSHNVI